MAGWVGLDRPPAHPHCRAPALIPPAEGPPGQELGKTRYCSGTLGQYLCPVLPILVIGLIFLGCGVFLAHRMSKRDDGQMFEPRDRVIITLAIFALLGAAGKTLLGGGAAAAAFGLVIP
jgi:hypothetical protein